MSQVDDWSDGYTSDYLRDLNTYGPASANVPRSSVVSHQVRYRAPDTSDIPLAPGQNPEGSVYSNAPGARMGQLKPRSGYNPPVGGGYTAKTFPSSGGSGRRYARPKKQTQVSKPAGKTQSAASAKRQVQNYGSYRDLSDPLSQHILANGSPEPKPPVESVVSRAQDITDQSDMYRAIAGLSSPPSANDSQSEVRTAGGINPAGAGSASVPETNFNRGLMGGVGRQVESMRAPDSEQPAQSVLAGPDESVKFANLPPEVLRDIAERKGRSFAGNLFNDIPWWAFALGGPSNAGMNKAFDFARSKFADAVNSTMRYGSARGAPTESFAQPAASASAGWRTGRTAEYPAGTGKFDQFGGWGESGRSAVGTGSAPASDGAAKLGEQTVSYKDSVARLADAGTETAGREAAGADAAAGAAARQGAGEAAGALAPQLQKDLSAVRQKVLSEGDSFERIRDVLRTSAGRQELLPANIREACEPLSRIMEQGGGAALTPAEREAVQLYISKSVAPGAAGAAGREAATGGQAAGAGRAGEAAGTAARQGAGEAAAPAAERTAASETAADGGVSELANAGSAGREAAAGGQAASREAIVAARNAAVAKLDPQLQAALANVRKSLANRNISPRQVLHELGSPTASDKDFYEIGRIFFEVDRATHGAGLSPAEQAVANAYAKSFSERMSRSWTEVGRGLTQAVDKNTARDLIDGIKDGTLDPNSVAYIRLLATRNAELTPDAQALLDAARAAGLIP